MIPAAFDYDVAESVDHAVELLGEGGGDAKLLAGGHSLLPALKLRIARPSTLVDIGRLVRPRVREGRGTHVAIGALTRHAAVAADPLLAGALPDRLVHSRRRSATRRCVIAARSAGRSLTATRRRTCPP